MTKVVYNACYGGFGLSDEAMKRYGELKGLNLVYISDEKYQDTGRIKFGAWYRDGIKDSEHYVSTYDFERDDPVLVQVVEELGSEKASGEFSKLHIEELAEGTAYRIDEYDGRESVMTMDMYDWKIA